MTSQEIPLSLTPQQAARGAVVAVPLPSGAVRVRIPPARDGDLVRLWVGQQEVLLRIRVTAGASGGAKWLGVLVAAAVVVFVAVVANGGGDDSTDDGASTYSSPTYSSSYAYSYDPYTDDPYTDDPYTDDPYTDDPYATETTEEPDPYTDGTCLSGTLPDSTTAQEVDDSVQEVDCSSSEAHYQVIETIPFSSDLYECNDNSRTEYAYSYQYTLNGAAINEYVYCLIGLGSYAR